TSIVARAPSEPWRLIAPVDAPADKVAVDQLVSELQQAKFKHLIEEAPDPAALARYGLEPPQFVITAEALLGDGQRRTVKLEGGIENTFDGTVYLRRDGSPQVWSAEGGVRWSLQKSAYDLREKTIVEVDEAACTGLEVKTKVNSYSLQRAPDKSWRFTQPFESLA